MNLGLWALAIAILLFILGESGSGSGGGGPAAPGPKPSGVPQQVWRWASDVNRLAVDTSLPFDTSWALAVLWQESAGDPSPGEGGAGEYGIMHMRQVALDDVRQAYPTKDLPADASQLSGNPEQAIKAGLLYLRLNYERARTQGIPWATETAVRAYNEGPPPTTSASDSYWNSVQSKHDRLTS